jgi:hypothetical protein
MDTPNNLKAFNYITLRVFETLYESFPEPRDINGIKFVIECVIDEGGDTENTKNLHLLSHTIEWLEEEGFLRTKGQTHDGNISHARLTLKGLTIIGYIPTSIDQNGNGPTVIEKAKVVLGRGIEGASAEGIKSVVSSAFRLMSGYTSVS